AADDSDANLETVLARVDSASVALYFPWLYAPDPSTNATVLVPPVGHVAGAYARHDREHGVHLAPTDLVLHGLAECPQKLALILSDDDTDLLARRGINAIQLHGTDRVVINGATTAAISEDDRPIQIRRFRNYVVRSMEGSLHWTRLAPND